MNNKLLFGGHSGKSLHCLVYFRAKRRRKEISSFNDSHNKCHRIHKQDFSANTVHTSRFFINLYVHRNACHEYYHLHLWRFLCIRDTMQDTGCMVKRLLGDFVLEHNQLKYWMSFIACGCHFSRSYAVT